MSDKVLKKILMLAQNGFRVRKSFAPKWESDLGKVQTGVIPQITKSDLLNTDSSFSREALPKFTI